jgi:Ca-activated chloride channel family protein
VQFFRIPAQYGQQVRAAIALGEFTPPEGMGLTLQARMHSPLRDDVYLVVPPSTAGEATGISADAAPGATLQLNQAAPIQFRNREAGGTEARTSFLAGDYYLQLAVVPSDYSAQRLFEIPYVLDLDTVGESAEGPQLSGQGAVEDRTASDPGQAPQASDGGGVSDAGGAPGLEDPPSAQESGGLSLPPVVWALLGGLGGGVLLAAVVVGAVVLVRRGR